MIHHARFPTHDSRLTFQLVEHALQREVTIAVQRELAHFVLVEMLRDVEGDPAVVTHIRRDLVPLITGEHRLLFDADPECEA